MLTKPHKSEPSNCRWPGPRRSPSSIPRLALDLLDTRHLFRHLPSPYLFLPPRNIPIHSRQWLPAGLRFSSHALLLLPSLKIYPFTDCFAGSGGGPPEQQDEAIQQPFRIPNPLTSLKMLWAKDTALITLIYGIYYMNFSCLQASISTLFISLYGLSEVKAGLIYLPFGIGSCIGAYCSGSFPFHHPFAHPLLT